MHCPLLRTTIAQDCYASCLAFKGLACYPDPNQSEAMGPEPLWLPGGGSGGEGSGPLCQRGFYIFIYNGLNEIASLTS